MGTSLQALRLERKGARAARGFTLIELIAVVVILGIIAVVAVPQLLDVRQDARLATLQTQSAAVVNNSFANWQRSLASGNCPLTINSCLSGNQILALWSGPTAGFSGSYATINDVSGTEVLYFLDGPETGATVGARFACRIRQNLAGAPWIDMPLTMCGVS